MTESQRKQLNAVKYQMETQHSLNRWSPEHCMEVYDFLNGLYDSISREMDSLPKYDPYSASELTGEERKARQEITYRYNKLGEERSEVARLIHEQFS